MACNPYTNAWSDVIPLGSDPANTLDTIIQQLRLDIHERMDCIVQDWTTDPVVPLASAGVPAFAVSYDDALGVGVKAADYITIASILSVRFEGTAINENIVINLNEINTTTGTTNWQVANLYLPTLPNNISLPMSFVGRAAGDIGLTLRRIVTDVGANTITLIMDPISTLPIAVDLTIQLAFTTTP